MKKLLLVLLMLPLCSMAQVYIQEIDTIPVGKMDTIKCKALVTGLGDVLLAAHETNLFIVRIRKKYINAPGTFCYDCENYWEFIKYLDAYKKPLPKSVTVWITK